MSRDDGSPSVGRSPSVERSRLVGRRDVLNDLAAILDATAAGTFHAIDLHGDPGVGKSRLLGELAADARRRGLLTLWGRAAEFEEDLPFGAVIDALDDELETVRASLADRLGERPARLLATVFPSLAAVLPADPGKEAPITERYRLYRSMRMLLEELASPAGLMLILDDVHWADESTVELLDHLVRHPPRGRIAVAVAHRPAQASPRLAALVETVRRVPVDPLSEPDVEEILGPSVSRTRRKALFAASRGNPFYLEALARMDGGPPVRADATVELGELPPAVRAALRMELSGLSPAALRIARAAAVTADEFEPALAAVTAETTEDAALAAIDELVARDVVRPASPGRFRFRHPLVRHAAYDSAAAGWRHAAHARIAAHLATVGAPATARARHVERSGRFGDGTAVATLVEAARAVATHAPVTAAHWLRAALRLMPATAPDDPAGSPDGIPARVELLLELSTLQAVGGQLTAARDSAREVIALLPPDDHARRARAVRICALMERQLDRPHEARAVLLDELRRIPDPQSSVAIPLRMRLVAESLMRGDFMAAQAVLDLMPENADDWEPSLPVAVAALRPLPAYAAGRVRDAVRYMDAADERLAAATDDHLADWMDAITWLCWSETMVGRHVDARRHFERALGVARATGQSYIMTTLLAGQARTHAMLGRLPDAAMFAEEAAELARMLGSGQQQVFAVTQQCLIAALSGDEAAALRYGEEALRFGAGQGEWWGAMARYASAVALIYAGRTGKGADALREACNELESPVLDQGTLLSCCELLAQAEATRGRPAGAARWADAAERMAHPDLEPHIGLVRLARAHALCDTDAPEAAARAQEAAELFARAELRVDAGRAYLRAGIAWAAAGDRKRARAELRNAAEVFTACGAQGLHGQVQREQRRLGVRVPGSAGRDSGPHGLSGREFEVASLVGEGYTNQQIAEKLYISIRTVETHLSHVFTKLGVTSRVGVVNALRELS